MYSRIAVLNKEAIRMRSLPETTHNQVPLSNRYQLGSVFLTAMPHESDVHSDWLFRITCQFSIEVKRRYGG